VANENSIKCASWSEAKVLSEAEGALDQTCPNSIKRASTLRNHYPKRVHFYEFLPIFCNFYEFLQIFTNFSQFF
jgi:hypothetical protein